MIENTRRAQRQNGGRAAKKWLKRPEGRQRQILRGQQSAEYPEIVRFNNNIRSSSCLLKWGPHMRKLVGPFKKSIGRQN
jgi:hypothetical protein